MKTYEELNPLEQTYACEQSLLKLLDGIVGAQIHFPRSKTLQDSIQMARGGPELWTRADTKNSTQQKNVK